VPRGQREKPPVAQLLKSFPNFMEFERSFPCSQEPIICPYPKPDQSIPRSPAMKRADLASFSGSEGYSYGMIIAKCHSHNTPSLI
jgi:hypothetical protein